jgi:hypothetical protein
MKIICLNHEVVAIWQVDRQKHHIADPRHSTRPDTVWSTQNWRPPRMYIP